MKSNTPRPRREAVLIALHPDGFVEAFSEKNIDVKIISVPHSPGSEVLAEDTTELMLPIRYRKLYFPAKIRASTMHRTLHPSVIANAVGTKNLILGLNQLELGRLQSA